MHCIATPINPLIQIARSFTCAAAISCATDENTAHDLESRRADVSGAVSLLIREMQS